MATSPSRILIVAFCVLLTGCSGGSEPIVFGVAGPFSQPRGESMRLAAELARDEINRAGGIGGRPLELRFLDDSANMNAAVRAAQQFADDPQVVAVIGHLTSATTLAAAPIYDGGDDPLPVISPSASSPEITTAGAAVFRVCPSDLVHGTRLGEYAMRDLGARRVQILYHNDDYGRGVRTAFADRFTGLGGVVVSQDPYLPDTPTLRPYLERMLRDGGADAVMIAGARAEAERIVATMDSLGLHIPILGADGLAGLEPPARFRAPLFVSYAYHPSRVSEANRAFLAAYGARFEQRLPDHRGAAAYDIVRLLARAVEAAGAERDAVLEYLAGVGSESETFDGVLGPIGFDANGDVSAANVEVFRSGAAVTPDKVAIGP